MQDVERRRTDKILIYGHHLRPEPLIQPTMVTSAKAALAVALFLFPGWTLARRVSNPFPFVAAFLGSAAVLFELILLFTSIGVRVDFGRVGVGLLIVGLLFAWRLDGAPASIGPPESTDRWISWWWSLPIAIAVSAIAMRAVVDPLSGVDNVFRWDYLARLLVTRGSLAGYPPMTAHDFEAYSWCDGVPPLVSCLDFWLYAAAGKMLASLSAIRVLAETILIGVLVARLSTAVWGRGAAVACLAVLASSSVFLWAVAMGQETGLTTLTFIAVLFLLQTRHACGDGRRSFWLGVAAGVGALTREYGLAYILFAGIILISQRASMRSLATFALTSLAITAPWYLRTWVITGNPLYPQACGGLFPTNPVYVDLARAIAREWDLRTSPYDRWLLVKAIGATAGVVLTLAVVGAMRAKTTGVVIVAGVAMVASLWLWSVSQTGGGWFYSLRVLAPALAASAVLCGWIAKLPATPRAVMAFVVTACAADAARRSWLLPAAPLTPLLPWSFVEWSERSQAAQEFGERKVLSILVQAAGGAGIVVDHPLYHSVLVAAGGHPVPLTSPALRATLRADRSFDETVNDLRHERIRFIVLNPTSTFAGELKSQYRFWNELLNGRVPTLRLRALVIYDLAGTIIKVRAETAANCAAPTRGFESVRAAAASLATHRIVAQGRSFDAIRNYRSRYSQSVASWALGLSLRMSVAN